MRRHLLLAAASLLIAAVGAPLAHAAPGKGAPPDHAPAHGVRGHADPGPVAEDPPLSIDVERARAEAIRCSEVPDAADDVDAVVLVHGTGTSGPEQYSWNYALRLAEEGIPFCTVTYPDRGFGDMQVSAEYVVVAVHEAATISPSGRVDLVGHSQGATMPRWAVKYWPSVQALVDDFVLHAGPNHGTWAADEPVAPALVGTPLAPFGARPPVLWQFRTDSDFNRYLNHGDETPGDISYTSIYAHTDELVQPSGWNGPATAALEGDPAKVVNINVQDVCPGRVVEHLSIGTTDRFTMELTIATLRTPGPADLSAIDTTWCTLPDQYLTPATLPALLGGGLTPSSATSGGAWLDPSRYVTEEPAIRDYAIARDGSAH